jgi:hypothetical protein
MGAPPDRQLLPKRLLSHHRFGYQQGLPDSLDVILIENPIVAEDGNIFRLRLSDQHSVEWISVLSRESSSAQRMFYRDWQGINSQLCEIKGKVTDEFLSARQLAQTNFGGYFPSRYSTDEDLITTVFDHATCPRAKGS